MWRLIRLTASTSVFCLEKSERKEPEIPGCFFSEVKVLARSRATMTGSLTPASYLAVKQDQRGDGKSGKEQRIHAIK